jgi:hypothetical protein
MLKKILVFIVVVLLIGGCTAAQISIDAENPFKIIEKPKIGQKTINLKYLPGINAGIQQLKQMTRPGANYVLQV